MDKIFSGEGSKALWAAITRATESSTMYSLALACQQLEDKIDKKFERNGTSMADEKFATYVKQLEAVVRLLAESVEATGGVKMMPDGPIPVGLGDLHWYSIGTAYMEACKVLGQTPDVDNQCSS